MKPTLLHVRALDSHMAPFHAPFVCPSPFPTPVGEGDLYADWLFADLESYTAADLIFLERTAIAFTNNLEDIKKNPIWPHVETKQKQHQYFTRSKTQQVAKSGNTKLCESQLCEGAWR
jgi:hypothetical protein